MAARETHKRCSRLTGLMLLSSLMTAVPLASAQDGYAIVDLGIFAECAPYSNSWAHGLNDLGVVVGHACGALYPDGFAWSMRSGLVRVEPGAELYGSVFDINNVGVAVGNAEVDSGAELHPFLLSRSSQIDLGTLGGPNAAAFALNDLGVACGESDRQDGLRRACMWDPTPVEISPLAGYEFEDHVAQDVNNLGQVVGYGGRSGDRHAWFWEDGETLALEEPGTQSGAFSVSDNRQIAGWVSPEGRSQAVVWEADGSVRFLTDSSDFDSAAAFSINNSGDVVGHARAHALEEYRAFLWTSDSGLRKIDDILPPLHRWFVWRAEAISDTGLITGVGARRGVSDERAYLVVPISAAFQLDPPVPGHAGVKNTIQATGLTPGAQVAFFYGRHGGGAVVSGCDLLDATLQIENANRLGVAVADAQGVAEIVVDVPARSSGQTALIQAVDANNCMLSNLVMHTIE